MELKVEKLLKQKRIKYRLVKLSQEAYTVADVVKYSEGKVEPEEICKTIILKGKKSGEIIATFLRGSDMLDFSKAKKLFGERMTIADSDEVKRAAGVEPGAVCPFLLKVLLVVDKKVLALKRINCGSGHHLYGLEFDLKHLTEIVTYKTADLS